MKQNVIFIVAGIVVTVISFLLDNIFSLLLVLPVLMFVTGKLVSSAAVLREKPGDNTKAYFWNVGYKTGGSMRSQETWEFANTYYGKLCVRWSMPMLVLSEGIMFLFQRYAWTLGILFAVQIVLFLSPILVVESAIDKRFDRQGNRREQ